MPLGDADPAHVEGALGGGGEAHPPTFTPALNFPVIGIGASAGGLAAFEAFFSELPKEDLGMAFVLVQHLAPDHKSILHEIVGRYTRMQVHEATDGVKVGANCTYIIPPNKDMALVGGELRLTSPTTARGNLRLPIDFFFRSLAREQGERAICVVLSGTGSDGTLGLRAIKGEGGMAMAQAPETTEHDGMPRNAIATGLVDYVLPAREMPAQLMAYV
ncbi:MAG TPA: chemotaxis protein CheB, partial [Steroidobacteraceae bacterium]|nr:chemotaxis protein CheB [Steroidobacteraceae bacterium]